MEKSTTRIINELAIHCCRNNPNHGDPKKNGDGLANRWQSASFHGWEHNPKWYKVARLMARARYYPGTPRGVTRMWHNAHGSTIGTVKGIKENPTGLARSTTTNFTSMFRSGSHQSCTRGFIKPTHMTDTLNSKAQFTQDMVKGFEPEVHCPTGAPREAMVKITRAEAGGLNGKGLWRPAANGIRPTYENEIMKSFLVGKYSRKSV